MNTSSMYAVVNANTDYNLYSIMAWNFWLAFFSPMMFTFHCTIPSGVCVAVMWRLSGWSGC